MNMTARDIQDTALRRLGLNGPDLAATNDCRLAIIDALNELWGKHDSPWYQQQGVIQLNGPYDTGTVTYVAASRRFTLTGGAWPTWAIYGTIRINGRDARV